MDTLLFLMIVAAFVLFRGIPKEQKEQIFLRLEYELYKWGFIKYRD